MAVGRGAIETRDLGPHPARFARRPPPAQVGYIRLGPLLKCRTRASPSSGGGGIPCLLADYCEPAARNSLAASSAPCSPRSLCPPPGNRTNRLGASIRA